MSWIVDYSERYENIDNLLDLLFNPDNYCDDNDGLDEWIDDAYYDNRFQIGGTTIMPSTILKECEPYIYDELRGDYAQNSAENDRDYYRAEIEEMKNGSCEYYNGFRVDCVEEESDVDEQEETSEEIDSFNALIA